jgi:coproporphyrinogen III oxidase-like Fe-S oxidoreductase
VCSSDLEIWREPVSSQQAIEEELFLGLRLTRGINWDQLRTRCGRNCIDRYERAFENFTNEGWIEWTDSTVRLTPLGMLFSNEIFQQFI